MARVDQLSDARKFKILNKFDIEDLHINEPPIDEVIGKILINKK